MTAIPTRIPATRPRTTRRPVTAPTPQATATNASFGRVIMGMFIGCLLLTLFLNTFTEQASFQKRELQTQIAQTTALRQRLEAEVARTESPENLLTIAKKMGMVPAAAPVFLRLSDHKILGKPIPAAG